MENSNVYVKKVSTYISGISEDSQSYDPQFPEGQERVLLTCCDYPITADEAMLALPAKEGAKIGSVVIAKGISLERASKQFTTGKDLSSLFEFGDADDEGYYPLVRK